MSEIKKTRETPCDQCPFTTGGIRLLPDTMAEITEYVIKGRNHLCHKDTTDQTICRGGRDLQLRTWHCLGMIKKPTDEALREATLEKGVQPKSFI